MANSTNNSTKLTLSLTTVIFRLPVHSPDRMIKTQRIINLSTLLCSCHCWKTMKGICVWHYAVCLFLRLQDDNLRTEPKYILFLSKLLLLFQFCHSCKADNPMVETREVGTMIVVTTTCQNPKCPKKEVWFSQPYMPGTKIPAGNFLLCFAILVAGGFACKVIQIFGHMGLACICLSTFFRHRRVSNIQLLLFEY